MVSNERSQDWRRLSPMVVAALVLHGLLLLLALPTRPHSDRASIELQWVELARPETAVPTPAESSLPAEERLSDPQPEPEVITPAAPLTTPATPTPAQDAPMEPSPAAPSAQRLRELALLAGRAQTERTAPSRPGLEGFAVPRLPGETGWLNDHVGMVSPYAERWLEADGASAARVVTASGQVFCGQARAATAAEEFNPWMSAVVMSWRPCGRERPEPVDRSSPWQRGAGAAGQ